MDQDYTIIDWATFDSEDDFRSGCRNNSHQEQFFTELLYRTTLAWTITLDELADQ